MNILQKIIIPFIGFVVIADDDGLGNVRCEETARFSFCTVGKASVRLLCKIKNDANKQPIIILMIFCIVLGNLAVLRQRYLNPRKVVTQAARVEIR